MKKYAEILSEIEQQMYARAGKIFDISNAQQLGAVLDELGEQDPINDMLAEYHRYAQLNAISA